MPLKYVEDILQTEDVLTVEEYTDTHTHAHAHTHTYTHTYAQTYRRSQLTVVEGK